MPCRLMSTTRASKLSGPIRTSQSTGAWAGMLTRCVARRCCIASNTVGMDFYRRLGATVVHQDGDTVTLQIHPFQHRVIVPNSLLA